MASIAAAKQALRKQVKTLLKQLQPSQIMTQSNKICEKLIAHPDFQKSHRISVYLSMTKEVNTERIFEEILKTGKKCFIPYYKGDNMEMLLMKSQADYDSLPETAWKIKQPADDDVQNRENALNTGGLDLILVPGLAFSKDGNRCGRGRGYYDKYLQRCIDETNKTPVTIGLAFSEQIVDDVPVTPNDFKVDAVIYPTE
ncbi:5-formyltetrahydrofolate cyclo-ligase-like [Tubulanus polymorphus]|uniref:5-formyltetrahydrofolate cyclo-ligase-like n=1 Tax=Tubulanus polymorphus TaxID=672921 RepID=UPI003DA43BFE